MKYDSTGKSIFCFDSKQITIIRKELELRVALEDKIKLIEKQNVNLKDQISVYDSEKLLSSIERGNQIHQINLQIDMIKEIDKQRRKEKSKKNFWKVTAGAFVLGFVYQIIK